MLHKPKPLGYADVSLEAILKLGGAHGTVAPQWYALKPCEGMGSVAGEVECRVIMTAGGGDPKEDAVAEAANCRWFPDEDDDDDDGVGGFPSGQPNLLKVAVIRGKELTPMDSTMFGSKSSDPFVSLAVLGGGEEAEPPPRVKTRVMKKDLNPVWAECLEVPLPIGGVKDKVLDVRVEDKDFASSTYMGGCHVRLDALPELLEDGSAPPVWHLLAVEGREDDDDDDVGELQLACKLAYDPALDPSEDRPFFEEAMDLSKPPNELRVAVCRCKDLMALDSAVSLPFKRSAPSSDPYVKVFVEGDESHVQKTRTIKKSLAPVYNATFAFEIDGAAIAGGTAQPAAVFEASSSAARIHLTKSDAAALWTYSVEFVGSETGDASFSGTTGTSWETTTF